MSIKRTSVSAIIDSKRRTRPKKIRYAPFKVVALMTERQRLEEMRIREAYARAREGELKNGQ